MRVLVRQLWGFRGISKRLIRAAEMVTLIRWLKVDFGGIGKQIWL